MVSRDVGVAGTGCATAGAGHTRSATSAVSIGALFVCPHCGESIVLVEPTGDPETHPDDFRCDCGAVLEAMS